MNRKGDNNFHLNEEKAKYCVGMVVCLKQRTATIISITDNFITVAYEDGIKESFVWHELFSKYEDSLREVSATDEADETDEGEDDEDESESEDETEASP
ncbi:hypothetical protein ABB02_01168 [Clostridiaceae bacterium JG1575]|nr:hypothetical protein ABB02_01168 [Clostridiaceae bacterium JG1575]